MVDLALGDQIIEERRRAVLELVDVDTGIEEDSLAGEAAGGDEGELVIGAAGERAAGFEPCTAARGVEIEIGQIRSRESGPGRLFHGTS